MASKLREFLLYFYLVIAVVGLVFLFFSTNYLFFHNSAVDTYSFGLDTVGNWNDWIFIISLFISGVFVYYVYKWIDDDRFFMRNINSDSKSHFMKNMKKLEKIAREHGSIYQQMLQNKKSFWKIRA
ncbi:MAG: DUF3198 domain-containing protein [Candidatus Thermoplasmatota archaeon]|nr:DUF3198 domain-containing protein [Candidatus Thermoplasmatota archaeon]MCL5889429.1 DUF3198 domain-containing protein [Candidatus Thermoplasmatota archaeon]